MGATEIDTLTESVNECIQKMGALLDTNLSTLLRLKVDSSYTNLDKNLTLIVEAYKGNFRLELQETGEIKYVSVSGNSQRNPSQPEIQELQEYYQFVTDTLSPVNIQVIISFWNKIKPEYMELKTLRHNLWKRIHEIESVEQEARNQKIKALHMAQKEQGQIWKRFIVRRGYSLYEIVGNTPQSIKLQEYWQREDKTWMKAKLLTVRITTFNEDFYPFNQEKTTTAIEAEIIVS